MPTSQVEAQQNIETEFVGGTAKDKPLVFHWCVLSDALTPVQDKTDHDNVLRGGWLLSP
jgi:hypothetical protein